MDKPSQAWDASSVPQDTGLLVRVAPRRARIIALTALVVGVIVVLTLVFQHGLELQRFDRRAKSPGDQTQLLDDYNAYAAYVSAAFGKPLELFVAMAAQLTVLRVLATQLTRPQPSWWVPLVALAASASVGYLVNNGFNALNVQLRPREVRAAISAADLSTSVATASVNLANQSTPELVAGNPAANTVLRGLLMPPVSRIATVCQEDTSRNVDGDVPDHFLNTGIPRRDWFTRVLPRALPADTLRLVVNPTDPAANANVKTTDLPMDATLAADLVLYAMVHGREYFGSGDIKAFQNDTDVLVRYPQLDKLVNYTDIVRLNGSMAEILGLLPPHNSDGSEPSETAKRETLFRESVAVVQRAFQFSKEVKQSDLSIEFSHVTISSSVAFDAVTLQFEVDPMRLANAATSDNSTRFTNVDAKSNCGPWPRLCLVDKVRFRSQFTGDPLLDAPAQVKALSPCVDARGVERLTIELNSTAKGFREKPLCPQKSNSSMLVVSFAKRLAADKITPNTVQNASGAFPDPVTTSITNLRKIFTFTIGRLAWQDEDLAATHNAECTVTPPASCRGLQLPLENESTEAPQERLVVGVEALPTERFVAQGLSFGVRPRFASIVEAYEPEGSEGEPALGGEPLLIHNIAEVATEVTASAQTCYPRVEDRLRLIVHNHYYSEHSLQPAYTAATWFLFQNAVVKKVITLEDGRLSLDFAANIQEIAVWLSTPTTSGWLTLAGCMLLTLGICAAVLRSFMGGWSHSLRTITDPHVIARVLIDDKQFPSRLLRRRVMEGDASESFTSADERIIGALTLRPADEKEASIENDMHEISEKR